MENELDKEQRKRQRSIEREREADTRAVEKQILSKTSLAWDVFFRAIPNTHNSGEARGGEKTSVTGEIESGKREKTVC